MATIVSSDLGKLLRRDRPLDGAAERARYLSLTCERPAGGPHPPDHARRNRDRVGQRLAASEHARALYAGVGDTVPRQQQH